MGRLWLFSLVVATSCSTAVPIVTPSGARSAAPSATTAPVETVVATPRPSSTSVDKSKIGPAGTTIVTPRPALPLPVVNAPCVDWPADVAVLLTQLPMPPSICLVRTASASVGTLTCTVVGCVPVTKGCDDEGQCLQIVEGTSPHYVLVFIHPPASPPPPIGEGYAITRSLCRMHQYRSLNDVVLPGAPPPAGGWLSTLEAREFVSAFDAFRTSDAVDAERWKPQTSDFENYADVCAAWYFPAGRGQRVSDYTPLLLFAKKWLPLPQ